MSGVDGINADDPGVALLTERLLDVPSREVLLVHCGDLPRLQPGSTRLILDVREPSGANAHTIEDALVERIPQAQGFAHAAIWPRAHLGKDFTAWCLGRAAQGVRPGGNVWCAIRKVKGAASIADLMRMMIGPVEVVARSKGYRLLRASIGDDPTGKRAAAIEQALGLRYEYESPPALTLKSSPGVFSRRRLDEGTAALIEHVESARTSGALAQPRRVIDLCAGVGPLALYAAATWPQCSVLAVESNVVAAALARHNAEAAGLAERVTVLSRDGLPGPDEAPERRRVPADLALVNPPTHADPASLARLIGGLSRWVRGEAWFVVSRPGRVATALADCGATVRQLDAGRYTVLRAHW